MKALTNYKFLKYLINSFFLEIELCNIYILYINYYNIYLFIYLYINYIILMT